VDRFLKIFTNLQFRNYSLRTKQLVALLSVSLLVMVVFGIITYTTSRSRILVEVGTLLQTNADAQGRATGDFLAKQADTLTTLGKRLESAVAIANASYTGSTAEIQAEIAQLDQEWQAADKAGNDQDSLVASRINNSTASVLREYRQDFPENVEVFLTDQYGAIIGTTNRTSDYYQADEEWWQTAYNNGVGKIYIGEMGFDESSQTFAADVAIPIYAPESSHVVGVLRTTVTMQSVLDLLASSVQMVESVRSDVLFPSGLLLSNGVVEEASPDLQTSIRSTVHQYAEFNYKGVPEFVSVSPIHSDNPGIDNMGWLIVLHQDRQSALAPVNTQLRTIVVVGVILAGLTVIIAFLLARNLTKPVIELTAVAQKVASGDLMAEASVSTSDEVGQLASTFNSMTRQLHDLIGSLEQRVAARTRALATSSEVSRRLSTILNRKQLVIEVVEQVKEAFGYYHAHIYLVEGDELVMAGGTGDAGAAMLAEGHKLPKGRGLVGRAAESNEPVLVPDTTHDPDWLPNPLLPDTKSEVAIPISVGNQVLGVLDVQHDQTNGLGQEDVDALQSIANQVAVAMQNINQYERTQKVAADLGVVADVGIATSTITEAGHLLQEVVDLSKRSFNLYHAHIYLLNETGDVLALASGAGEVGRKMVAEGRQIPLNSEQSLVARAARTQEGVVVNDVQADPNFLPNPLLPKTRAEMAVPMLVSGKVIGVLDVQSEQVNRFTDTDVNIQTTLASQIAVALQNARSFTNAQKQAERETKLNLIAQKIQSTATIEEAMQIAARELGHALGKRQTLVALEPSALAGDNKGVAIK
jgi:GAF domain-containing protein/HAMP domain-containing protein